MTSLRSRRARAWGVALALGTALAAGLDAQTRRARPRPPAAPVTRVEPAMMTCPQVLGDGVRTKRQFCEVLIGRDPAAGVLVSIPPHTGLATLLFDLHNRHTYSEAEVKAKRAYRRYTATIGALTLDNTLISRAAVQNEFRTELDLVDRITGGGGPTGLKAVAPTGTEAVAILIPEDVTQVSILGEKLAVIRVDGVDNFLDAPGRPIALISNVQVEYRPAPARPATRRRR